MADVVLTPDPQRYPPGTKVKFYPEPTVGGKLEGQPPGTLFEEATVAADGTLTVKGVTEGAGYVGWTSGNTYLHFVVPLAVAGAGISKGEAETLIAEKAVSTVSPAFTGTPTAPTAAPGTNTTQLATTAFAAAIAALKANVASPTLTGVPAAPTAAALTSTTQLATTDFATKGTTVEKERAEAAEALKAALASPTFTGIPAAPTAAVDTNTTQLATTAYAKKEADDGQAAAEAASTPRLAVHASVVTNATTATVNQHHPVNATAENRTIKLPTGQPAGSVVAIEKNDTTQNLVTVEGNIRGVAESTTVMRSTKDVVTYIADASGSWWPIARTAGLEWTSVESLNANLSATGGSYPSAIQCALGPDGMVRMSGTFTVGTEVAAKGILFTLPAACRPEKQHAGIVCSPATVGLQNVLIKANGEVEVTGALKVAQTPFSVDLIAFRLKG